MEDTALRTCEGYMTPRDPLPKPGDVVEFTIITGADRHEETLRVLVQRVHEYPNGSLRVTYQHADNHRGVTWSCYVTPEHAAQLRILEHREPTAVRSLLPA